MKLQAYTAIYIVPGGFPNTTALIEFSANLLESFFGFENKTRIVF